jgi:cysteine-rich repeat protein
MRYILFISVFLPTIVMGQDCQFNSINIEVIGLDSDIGWSIAQNNGWAIVSGGLGSISDVCIEDGCFPFNMYDGNGDDGWNETTIIISYSLTNEIIFSGTLNDGFFEFINIQIGETVLCPVYGCTNSNATNYDSTATIEDGTCLYDQVAYDVAMALCPECINEDQIDEGFSCIEIWEPVCGCNNVTYSNDCYAFYNGVTEWTDGECEFLTPYNPDFDNDEIIGVNDLLALLSVFGSPFNSNAVCGNGIVEDGEDCDDGNDIPGDGCAGCMFDGIIQE